VRAGRDIRTSPDLQEYRSYLQQDRGLAASTIANYTGVVRRFLTSISGPSDLRLASIRGADITDYIRRHAPQGRTFAAAKDMVTALRPFFQFARYRDYDLAAAVPSVAGWSMASIPRALPAESVRRLLDASKTWRTPAGLRNRAILLLLARLGLRAPEIVRLELEDIDWSQVWLRVHGKGRQDGRCLCPMTSARAYLKDGRPESACRRLFLRSRAPFDGLGSHSDICQIVHRAIDRAGIELKVTGAHQLRHALGVDMLRQGGRRSARCCGIAARRPRGGMRRSIWKAARGRPDMVRHDPSAVGGPLSNRRRKQISH
jgi:integrase/recombinase XerD